MKKKIFIIFIVLIFLISAGIFYLNQVVLPTKVKALIIRGIEDVTQKKVSLSSLEFNIFKGLVLRDLTIYDATKTILKVKESACTFLILPIFKKQLIIPTIRLKSPEIFVERKPDNSLNILDPFFRKSHATAESNFNLLIYKISLTDGRINFQDDTLQPIFTKEINNLNLLLYLSLPARVKFSLKFEIPQRPGLPTKINSSGEYNISIQELAAKITVKDLSPKEFNSYYSNLLFRLSAGKIDAHINIGLKKDKIINADLDVRSHDLTLSKDDILLKLNSGVTANLNYSLKDKQLSYSGKINIFNSDVAGIKFIERIDDIKGEVKFSNTGLSSENLSAYCFGIPIEAKLNLTDFSNPLLNVNIIASTLNLNTVQGILKDRFKLILPVYLEGQGKLSLMMQSKIPVDGLPQINGSVDILNAMLKLEKINSVLESINGRIEFSSNQLTWSGLNFKYLDTNYKTSGLLTNFQAPGVQLELSSNDLSLESLFAVNGKLVNFSKIKGRYINSDFSLTADIDITDPSNIKTDINAGLNIDLNDIKKPLKKFKDRIEKIKPSGILQVEGNLKGNINDIKSCAIEAKLSSSTLSLYGLKSGDFLLNYNQQNGIADIPLMHLSLYDGSIDAIGTINLASDNLPYWISADIKGIKLEKLKLDIPVKDKDISGTIQAQAKINGFSNDFSRLNGAGTIIISNGKLWQLNLFKGIGALLFTSDFTNLIFSEGSCGFVIQDKYIFTDNLKLKSNLSDISGLVKIGFDNSIDATLNVEVSNEAPLTGTIRDVTTAILGAAKRFGIIRITGTLKEPQYKFKPAVVDILKSLKDTFLKK